MPTPSLSAAKKEEILSLIDSGMTNREVAKAAKVAVGTVSKVRTGYRSNKSKDLPGEVNMPVDSRDETGGDTTIVTPDKPLTVAEMAEKFGIDLKVWTPVHVKTNQWQGFYKKEKFVDRASGTSRTTPGKVALYQTTVTWKRIMGETLQLMLLDFFRENVKPLAKSALPKMRDSKRVIAEGQGQMVAWGLWDAHLGQYAWASEVGESMDLTKAISRITNSIDDMVVELAPYPIEKIVMPIGNDFMHYDNVRQRTTFGEHHLDADGRYAKVLTSGLRCLIYMIERALEISPSVHIVYTPGNHDLHSSYALCVALSQRFLNDERVTFDLSANPRKYVTFGGTLLGFDHGQGANAKQLSLILSTECRDVWSQCTYREVQIGHTHQKRVAEFESLTPTNGVTIRTNPALCNVDVWHHNLGLIGEPMKSVEAWRYDRTGYRGSHCAWARDDYSEAVQGVRLT